MHVVADLGVVVDGEPDLLAVEALGPVHVRDRDDDDLELPVHMRIPPRGGIASSYGAGNYGDAVPWRG